MQPAAVQQLADQQAQPPHYPTQDPVDVLDSTLSAVTHAPDSPTDAVQILGGYGYTKEYPVEKLYRDAKLQNACEIGSRGAAPSLAGSRRSIG